MDAESQVILATLVEEAADMPEMRVKLIQVRDAYKRDVAKLKGFLNDAGVELRKLVKERNEHAEAIEAYKRDVVKLKEHLKDAGVQLRKLEKERDAARAEHAQAIEAKETMRQLQLSKASKASDGGGKKNTRKRRSKKRKSTKRRTKKRRR